MTAGDICTYKRAGQTRRARLLRRATSRSWHARPISLADGKEYALDGDPARLLEIGDGEIVDTKGDAK